MIKLCPLIVGIEIILYFFLIYVNQLIVKKDFKFFKIRNKKLY